MNEQTVRFRLGIFVLITLILLAVMVILFGGVPGIFKPSNRYQLVFDTAEGVSQGTPVRRSGVRIGEVEQVELDEETGEVVVTVRVDSQYSLRKSDEAKLVQGFLGSDSYIDFEAKKAEPGEELDRSPIEPGSRVKGKTLAGARSVMQQASELVSPAQEALVDIRKTLQRFEKLAPKVEATLEEYRKVAENANEAIPEFQKTNKDFQDFAKAAKEAIPEIGETGKEFRKLAKNINDNMPEFQKTSEEFRKLAKSVNDSMPDFVKTSEEFRKLAKSINKNIPEVKKTNDEILKLARAVNKSIPELKDTNAELQKTVVQWGKVGERTEVLLQTNEEKVNKILNKTDKALEGVNDLLREENRKNVTEIIKEIRKGSKKIESITNNIEEVVKKTSETLDKIDKSVVQADNILQDIEKVTKPVSERSEKILTNLDEASTELNKALKDLRVLVQTVARSEGTVQKLLRDPTLYHRLDEAACLLTKTLPRLDRILRDVELFADRIARHPEALGIGGVVNPSSGLKELPKRPLWQHVP